MLEILNQWLGTVLGGIGILLAVFFYLRSRRKARLAYQFKHVTLVGGAGAAFPEEVEILFDGRPVPRVTATRFIVWNCGNQTINGADIVDSDPLRIQFPEAAQILRHSILREQRPVTACALVSYQEPPNEVVLGFDFLDPGDGVAFEVLHSGERQSNVLGTIRGIPEGPISFGRVLWSSDKKLRLPFPMNIFGFVPKRVFFGLMVILGLIFLLSGLFWTQFNAWFPSFFTSGDPDTIDTVRWPAVAIGLLYLLLPGTMLWKLRRRFPSALDPELSDDADNDEADQD